jgi:hypothetical protein
MTQPKISAAQIDNSLDGTFEEYVITALTRTNAFQEVFIGLEPDIVIDAADATLDTFTVAGDYRTLFPSGTDFHVTGSVSNDGDYTTVSDSTFAGGFTTIYTAAVPSTETTPTGTGLISLGTRLVLPDLSTAFVAVYSTARDTTTTGAGLGRIDRAVFTRDSGAATVARIGAIQNDLSRETLSGTPDVDITADTTNGSIKIQFKGGSTNLVTWRAQVLLNIVTE